MTVIPWGKKPFVQQRRPGLTLRSREDADAGSGRTLLGAGRSGRVYRLSGESAHIARKVFFGEAATHLVHYIFFGAPNPYIWNQDAVICAYYRRNILADLVKVWFGDQLRVSKALGSGWDQASRAFYLDTEFIAGRPVALCQPFRSERDRELPQQVHGIMEPLQQHLQQSGFDGLLWQVGKGNPSALNNFLLTDDKSKACHFAWIDLESGVPALFPLNLLTLFRFYLPQALRRRQALFDDVDIPRLQRYLTDQRLTLIATLGAEAYWLLVDNARHLAHHQVRWKTLSRLASSIQYHVAKGRLTAVAAAAALAHPWRWYSQELTRLAQVGLTKVLISFPHTVWNRLRRVHYGHLLSLLWRSCMSHRYRLHLARRYVISRVQAWQDREQLSPAEAQRLRQRLEATKSSDYLNDFCVHLALKLPIKAVRYALLPILYGFGLINGVILALLMVSGGLIIRQLYTLLRIGEAAFKGQSIPWVAFGVGFIPFMSTAAYPCQMMYSATEKPGDPMAQFILYDSLTRIGGWVPAWGGPDTLIEHWFNRGAHWLINTLGRLNP
ncbi:hypothetical protein [Nodosilinea sp. P-1105]|uniref:hypothetical protein n=1 Tax=Nodosilinea sp. P-1105 TaxID=2546229 RepID=UPI00146F218D|nr:hypothetical protein [Nodosilinea sp. P-1105]NMF86514.1 hypothetical protein [Nodosilinea sp. P-1105]